MSILGRIFPSNGARPYEATAQVYAGRVVVETAVDTVSNKQQVQHGAVAQHATFASLEMLAGIASNDAEAGEPLAVDCVQGTRIRVVAGAAVAARKYLSFNSVGKIIEYSHDATKFGIVIGYSVELAAAEDDELSMVYAPMIIGPASASGDDFTLTDDLIAGGDIITTGGRFQKKQGADVASATNLTLGSDGNVFEITGTTKIDLISNVGWQNGSEITLFFTSTANVDHGTVTSGTNITIKLDGSVDFVPAAGDMLRLMLAEVGGTQVWRETGRVVYA